MNIKCDHIANETVEAVLAANGHFPAWPILEPPYKKGSKAMLRINDVWITSNMPKHIYWAQCMQTILQYCLKWHKWREKDFHDVHWNSIESVCRLLPFKEQIRTCKILHGWMPVNHNLGKWTGITNCPGCKCKDETFEHLMQCTNELQVSMMMHDIHESLDAKWKKARIPAFANRAILGIMQNVGEASNKSSQLVYFRKSINRAIRQQERIGKVKLCRLYIFQYQFGSIGTKLFQFFL